METSPADNRVHMQGVIMRCRIGMTTNLQQSEGKWRRQYPTLRDWQVLVGPFYSKEVAKNRVMELARKHGCDAHQGSNEPDSPGTSWYLYLFNY